MKEDDLYQLYSSDQVGANQIREGRHETKMQLLNYHEAWFNSLLTVCFGIGAALIALGPSFRFMGPRHQLAYWVGTSLLMANGLFIVFIRKRRFEQDSNSASLMGYEMEHSFLKSRNIASNALMGKKPFNLKSYQDSTAITLELANKQMESLYERMKKADISADISVALLVGGLYLVTFGLTHIPPKFVIYYFISGIALVVAMLIEFVSSYRSSNEAQIKWMKKINKLSN